MKNDEKTKKEIIEQLKKTPIIQFGCQKTGISRSSLYRWKKEDNEFAQKVENAILVGSQLINDMAESQLISAIKEKNLGAIIFWLKNHHGVYAPKLKISGEIKMRNKQLTPEQKELIKKALILSSLTPNTNKLIDKKNENQESTKK